jgi:hypothetical protein
MMQSTFFNRGVDLSAERLSPGTAQDFVEQIRGRYVQSISSRTVLFALVSNTLVYRDCPDRFEETFVVLSHPWKYLAS